jgi:hypothetical protein
MPLRRFPERHELPKIETSIDHHLRLPTCEAGAMKRNSIRRKGAEPKADHDAEARGDGVQSVGRVLKIIETLAEGDQVIG